MIFSFCTKPVTTTAQGDAIHHIRPPPSKYFRVQITSVEEKIVTIFKCLLKKFLVRAHTYIFKLIKEAQHTISSHVANN